MARAPNARDPDMGRSRARDVPPLAYTAPPVKGFWGRRAGVYPFAASLVANFSFMNSNTHISIVRAQTAHVGRRLPRAVEIGSARRCRQPSVNRETQAKHVIHERGRDSARSSARLLLPRVLQTSESTLNVQTATSTGAQGRACQLSRMWAAARWTRSTA